MNQLFCYQTTSTLHRTSSQKTLSKEAEHRCWHRAYFIIIINVLLLGGSVARRCIDRNATQWTKTVFCNWYPQQLEIIWCRNSLFNSIPGPSFSSPTSPSLALFIALVMPFRINCSESINKDSSVPHTEYSNDSDEWNSYRVPDETL